MKVPELGRRPYVTQQHPTQLPVQSLYHSVDCVSAVAGVVDCCHRQPRGVSSDHSHSAVLVDMNQRCDSQSSIDCSHTVPCNEYV